jgi:ATP-binding protein involved in chromosome partitioning
VSPIIPTETIAPAQVPISVGLREGSDAGIPVVIANPQDLAAAEILKIADKFAEDQLGLSGRRLKLSV